MSIVITGATGQLGRLTVESLLAQGIPAEQIIATGRRTEVLADLAERGGDHRRDGVTTTKVSCRFDQRGGTLFGVGARFVLASRVSKVAWLGQVKSFDRGRRPALVCLELDGEFAAARVDRARRLDQRSFNRGSTPTISRMGRFPGSVRVVRRTVRLAPRGGAVRGRCRSPRPPPSL